MNDVMDPEVSAGSNHVGASETWTAQLIWPAGASARPSDAATARKAPTVKIRTMRTMVGRLRTVFMMEASFLTSSALQLHVLVRRRKRVSGDHSDPRLLHPWPQPAQAGVQPDRRDHGLLMDELLDAVQRRLAPLRVQLARLLAEQSIDVAITAVNVVAAGGDEGLDSRRRVAEGATAALDEPLILLFGPPPEEGRPLDRPELHPDASRVEVV